MRINSIEKRFLYVPSRREGIADFQGEFKQTEEVAELIRKEGLDYIRNKILTIIEQRKEMLGNHTVEYYGMHPQQRFYDLKNRIMIEVRDLILPENNIIQMELIGSSHLMKKASNIKAYTLVKSGKYYQHGLR
ncbi:MAG: hypothetical protein JXR05_17210 [Flavobacteriaceae bacterium]